MSISYQIPKDARFITTANVFNATFNNPTIGKYDFDIDSNKNLIVVPMQKRTIYLIERISVGGNISEELYLDAVNLSQVPLINPEMILKYSIKKERLYKQPFPILNYIDNKEITAWAFSEKGNNNLTMDFRALLNQTPALVGVAQVKIAINLSMYAIDNVQFYQRFRGELAKNVGMQVIGGL